MRQFFSGIGNSYVCRNYVGRKYIDLTRYVIYVRRDVHVQDKASDVVRQIGRCVTDNISDWYAVMAHIVMAYVVWAV